MGFRKYAGIYQIPKYLFMLIKDYNKVVDIHGKEFLVKDIVYLTNDELYMEFGIKVE